MRAAPLFLLLAAAARGSTLQVAADPRWELLGVVRQLASGAPSSEVAKAFAGLERHPAVAAYRLSPAGLPDPYGHIATYLTPPPELAWRRDPRELPGDFVDRVGGMAELEAWLASAREFSKSPAFAAFRDSRRERRARWEAAARAELAGGDRLAEIEGYMGRPIASTMTVVVSDVYEPQLAFIVPYPFGGPGRRREGPYEVVVSARVPPEGEPFFNGGPYRSGLLNEFLYAYVDAAMADRFDDVMRRAPADPTLGGGCGPNWQDCASETIVRALSERLDRRRQETASPRPGFWARLRARFKDRAPVSGRTAKQEALRRKLERSLAAYEAGEGGKDFDADFPRLIEAFGPARAR